MMTYTRHLDSVRLREAVPTDAATLVPLLEQLAYPSSGEQLTSRLERLNTETESLVIVASIDDVVAGVAVLQVTPSLEHDQPAGQLIALAVDQGYRLRGIGRMLVEATEDEARRRGCYSLALNSSIRRANAHRFYLRLGFTNTGKRFTKSLT